jgi:hypothetical protein
LPLDAAFAKRILETSDQVCKNVLLMMRLWWVLMHFKSHTKYVYFVIVDFCNRIWHFTGCTDKASRDGCHQSPTVIRTSRCFSWTR